MYKGQVTFYGIYGMYDYQAILFLTSIALIEYYAFLQVHVKSVQYALFNPHYPSNLTIHRTTSRIENAHYFDSNVNILLATGVP